MQQGYFVRCPSLCRHALPPPKHSANIKHTAIITLFPMTCSLFQAPRETREGEASERKRGVPPRFRPLASPSRVSLGARNRLYDLLFHVRLYKPVKRC